MFPAYNLKKLGLVVAIGSYLAATGTAVADDTEVFFNTTYRDTSKPNVLFIMDTSGSMGDRPASSSTGPIKIDIVKSALKSLLDSVSDINAGLARYTVPGGPILLPIKDIDLPADPLTTATITESGDDAEQATSGAVTINSSDLDIIEESGHAQYVGIRFRDVNVPQGATVTKAVVSLSALEDASTAVTLRIRGILQTNTAAFTTATNNISSRPTTTAYVDWTPTSWTTGNRYSSVDIHTIVQEVAAQSGWCGGNSLGLVIERQGAGTGKRVSYAYDSASPADSTRFPTLNIQYSGTLPSGANGCYIAQAVSSGANGSDDVVERGTSPFAMVSNSTTLRLKNGGDYKAVGLRFPNVKVPQGATILDSKVSFRNNTGSNWTGTATATVQGVAVDNFTGFTIVNTGLTGTTLSKTSSTTVTLPDWLNNTTVSHDSNLNTVISAITGRAGWTSGNSLGLIFTATSGSAERRASSYEGKVPATLTVRYRARFETGSFTVRDELKVATDQLQASGSTPLSDTLMEGALYYRGDQVLYGKTRNNNANNRISGRTSFTGGTVTGNTTYTSSCDPVLDPFASACASERIDGSPVYISPITDTCQSNHLVFLTDGEPTSHNASTQTEYTRISGGGTCTSASSGSDCFVKTAGVLFNNDQSTGLPGTQNVKSYFIGFDIDLPLLDSAAAAGGTESARLASDATSLAATFNEIIASIKTRTNTFVSAGVTVNQTNRLTHLDELYFSIFAPDITPRWAGNLKRYRLGDDGNIMDAHTPSERAVEDTSDQFKETARSWWSTEDDGNNPDKGGAASLLGNNRALYTNLGGTTNITLIASGNSVADGTTGITSAMLGAASATERTKILNWARGQDVNDEDGDSNFTEANKVMGDPLHSRPALISYKSGTGSYLRVFVGTNRGELQAFNTVDGSEQWAFVPTDLLNHYKTLMENHEATAKPYGLDSSVVTYLKDTNLDGKIDPAATGTAAEKAMLYVGMRRGGNKYYAVDVTNPANPILKFVIQPDAAYTRLGQTWSEPVIGRAKIGSTVRTVMIFGGGYDVNQDTPGVSLNDTSGNVIYIADALTGAKLWSSDEISGLGMNKGVPASVAAVDFDGNGIIDHVYAVDMGAQVWRLDLKMDGTISGGRLAHFQQDSTEVNNRRFYGGLDVALVSRGDGSNYVAVAAGSGYREKPLDENINEQFYVFRDEGVLENTITADLALDDLVDVTGLVGDSDTTDSYDSDAIRAIEENGKSGWYLDFATAGEKNLSVPVIFNNRVLFTTYVPPSDEVVNCRGGVGTGRFYAVSILDGNPVRDHDLADTDGDGDMDEVTCNNGDCRYTEIPDCPTCGFVPVQILSTDESDPGQCDFKELVGTKQVFAGCPRETVKRIKWRRVQD